MISFSQIMRRVLTERMSFRQLLAVSKSKPDHSRFDRAKFVNAKSLRVKTMDESETWTFSYKSQGDHSTTKMRHQGYVRFFKENVSSTDNVQDLECMVDCSCPDYRYRWAYNNAKADAGITGANSLNKNNGTPPRSRSAKPPGVGDLGEGLCKHLIKLGKYLETSVDAPDPKKDEEPLSQPEPKPVQVKKQRPSQSPTTTKSPEPDDTYTDSRSGDSSSGYSDGRELQEGKSSLYNRFEQFVRNNPEFEVPYE